MREGREREQDGDQLHRDTVREHAWFGDGMRWQQLLGRIRRQLIESPRMRLVLLAVLVGCGGGDRAPLEDSGPTDDGKADDGIDPDAMSIALPMPNARFDYQLGGAYAPASGVEIVSRDRSAPAASGLYNICYVNGFQIQPDEEMFWMMQHPDLILRKDGQPVIDPDWDEMLIDIRTPEQRAAVAAIVDGWIAGCAQAGYKAIEIDNLDSFTRSQGLLTEAQAVAMMRAFADAAHARGLAAAQKNAADLVVKKSELGTDFAVVEECNLYDECDVFTGGYGDHVIVIEYRRADFTKGCTQWPGLSIVLRDRDLVTPASGAYVHDDC
jgi:hypothetical protein